MSKMIDLTNLEESIQDQNLVELGDSWIDKIVFKNDQIPNQEFSDLILRNNTNYGENLGPCRLLISGLIQHDDVSHLKESEQVLMGKAYKMVDVNPKFRIHSCFHSVEFKAVNLATAIFEFAPQQGELQKFLIICVTQDVKRPKSFTVRHNIVEGEKIQLLSGFGSNFFDVNKLIDVCVPNSEKLSNKQKQDYYLNELATKFKGFYVPKENEYRVKFDPEDSTKITGIKGYLVILDSALEIDYTFLHPIKYSAENISSEIEMFKIERVYHHCPKLTRKNRLDLFHVETKFVNLNDFYNHLLTHEALVYAPTI